MIRRLIGAALAVVVAFAAPACGDDEDAPAPQTEPAADDTMVVVVTAPLLRILLDEIVGDDSGLTIEVLIPVGADPHGYELRDHDLETVTDADLLVTVGPAFEAQFAEVLGAAGPSTEIFVATQRLRDPIRNGDAIDPHFWHDPREVAEVVDALARTLGEVDPSGAETYERRAGEFDRALRRLRDEVSATANAVPETRRMLVTQHDFLGYFARRFEFEVAASVIPGFSSQGDTTTDARVRVLEALDEAGVCAVFDPASGSGTLSEVVAAEADGEVVVVPLLADTVTDVETTYAEMMRENANHITEALTTCG